MQLLHLCIVNKHFIGHQNMHALTDLIHIHSRKPALFICSWLISKHPAIAVSLFAFYKLAFLQGHFTFTYRFIVVDSSELVTCKITQLVRLGHSDTGRVSDLIIVTLSECQNGLQWQCQDARLYHTGTARVSDWIKVALSGYQSGLK